MSLTFTQICDQIDKTLGIEDDPNAYPLADKVVDINLAIDRAEVIIFSANGNGRWKFDDTNHDDYPIITADIVAGQRDYSFEQDQDGNFILDILRVFMKRVPSQGGTGVYEEIYPLDPTTEEGTQSFTDGLNVEAVPYAYQKLGNGIILNTVPPENVTAGLKMYVSREGSYFTTADTTKRPGIAGLFHEYFVLRPAYRYAQRNNLSIAGTVTKTNATGLISEVLAMERDMKAYYGNRARDERAVARPRITRFK